MRQFVVGQSAVATTGDRIGDTGAAGVMVAMGRMGRLRVGRAVWSV
jgi:hypothetical protein